MNPAIDFKSEKQVAKELGKRSRPAPSWAAGKRRVCVGDDQQVTIRAVPDDVILKDKYIALFITHLRNTEHRTHDSLDLRRQLVTPAVKFCKDIADTIETFTHQHSLGNSELQNLRSEQETWQLLSALLSTPEAIREGILLWIQSISQKRVSDAIDRGNDMPTEDRFFFILGWLVAANLDVDAARLAVAEGMDELGDMLLCRHDPERVSRHLRNYSQSRSRHVFVNSYFSTILDFLAGRNERLLQELDVEWRIRLGSLIWSTEHLFHEFAFAIGFDRRFEPADGRSIGQTLEEFAQMIGTGLPEHDLQFQILLLFAAFYEGRNIDSHKIAQILHLNEDGLARDACFKWQLCLVLVTAGVIDDSNEPRDSVSQLYHTLIDQCIALGIPEWSIFVCMQQPLGHPEAMRSLVSRFLNLSIQCWIETPEMVHFFFEKLQIPSAWIEQSKALWYASLRQSDNELQALIGAGMFAEAHKVLFLTMDLKLLISENDNSLEAAVEPFRQHRLPEHQHKIPEWDIGGGLIIAVHRFLLNRDIEPDELLASFTDEMQSIWKAMHKGHSMWRRFADSSRLRTKVDRCYQMLAYRVEQRHCQVYTAVHGSAHIMSRILTAKCNSNRSLLFLQQQNSSPTLTPFT